MTKKLKQIVYALMGFALLIPAVVSAHVKWFEKDVALAPAYSLGQVPVIVGILLVLFAVFVGMLLEKYLKVPKKFQKFADKQGPKILSIATIGFGIAFSVFSLNAFIFAPNFPANGTAGLAMMMVQLMVGLMLLFGFYVRIAGVLLMALYVFAMSQFGAAEMLDAFEILGMGMFALIVGRPVWQIGDTKAFHYITEHFKDYGIPILRVAAGLNLMVLGFSEKLLNPGLATSFLSHYNWNFMEQIGISWFSNYWFVYAAGLSEILFGLMFVLGLATRVTTVALAVFLLSTLTLLGPVELMGHLPHFSIALVLFVLGSGSRLLLIHRK